MEDYLKMEDNTERKILDALGSVAIHARHSEYAIGEIAYEGTCIFKEDNKWIVAGTNRGHIQVIYGAFPHLVYASFFFLDEISSFEECGKLKRMFCDILNHENVDY